jgi:hypothetical protein
MDVALVVLFFVFLYFALLIAAPIIGYQLARRRGWSPGKCWSAASVGFLLIFMPMFWDWLPTLWLHSYYCDRYSGVVVNKTPGQWIGSNPAIADQLRPITPPLQVGLGENYYRQLNQRIRLEIRHSERLLSLREERDRLVDTGTGEVLAEFVDFTTGQSGSSVDRFRDLKVWMRRESCDAEGKGTDRKKFVALTQAFENLGVQK